MADAAAPAIRSTLSRNSSTILSAVFLPTPGIRVSFCMSPDRMALVRSAAAKPESTVMPSFGPMPLTEISFSNNSLLFAGKKSEQGDRIFANMGVNAKSHLAAGIRQR